MKQAVTIQRLRCSGCNKTFTAYPSSKKAACPHCKSRYVIVRGEWQNAKLYPKGKA